MDGIPKVGHAREEITRDPPLDPRWPASGPTPLSSFVGRERELARIVELVTAPAIRLVTLTGPGGVGKTRLGLTAIAHLEAAFSDGVVFVPFEAATDPGQAPVLIAQAAGVPDAPGQSLAERMQVFFHDRSMLLLLDNLEHLATVESHVATLLAASRQLKILCTSRSRLGITGEQVYPVPPMALADAIALFEQRARSIDPNLPLARNDEEIIARICDLLDGLPLAIELAAARVDVLPPPALTALLNDQLALLVGGPGDAPARQRTMRATIAWSYDLLEPAHQALFRRLAVFSGGFTLDAVQVVMPDPSRALDSLSALVASNLVRRMPGPGEEPRFQLAPTIREYAREVLAAQGETDEIRIVHAAYCLALAEQARPYYDGPEGPAYRDRTEANLDNFRAAMAWGLESNDGETAIRIAGALWCIWWPVHSMGSKAWTERIEEGLAWIYRSLSHQEELPFEHAVEAMVGAGALNRMLRRYKVAAEHSRALLRESEAHQSPYGEYWACAQLGNTARDEGDLEGARSWLRRALAAAPRMRNPDNHEAMALGNLSDVARADGDNDEALVHAEAAMIRARSCGNPHCISWLGLVTGRLRLDHGDGPGAADVLVEGTRSYLYNEDVCGARTAFTDLGRVALAMGHPDIAATLLLGIQDWPAHEHDRPIHDTAIADAERCLGADTWDRLRTTATRLPVDDLLNLAASLATLPADAPVPPSGPLNGLTAREVDVLRLLANGRPNREIATALSISGRTVENHVAHILAKLDLDSRTAAATWAVRNGLA